jgi:hypothetical protein
MGRAALKGDRDKIIARILRGGGFRLNPVL